MDKKRLTSKIEKKSKNFLRLQNYNNFNCNIKNRSTSLFHTQLTSKYLYLSMFFVNADKYFRTKVGKIFKNQLCIFNG